MNKNKIVQKNDPVLRKKARSIEKEDLRTDRIKEVITNMKSALHDTEDGVAIAAPQIGESLCIFIINKKIFASDDNPNPQDKVFINPEIINTSQKKVELDEGCLSVKNIYGKIERSAQATVRACDEAGEEFELGGSGLIAQIFQHETDHLDGVLFIDKATDLQEITSIEPNEEAS
jgi:peptide deformylase